MSDLVPSNPQPPAPSRASSPYRGGGEEEFEPTLEAIDLKEIVTVLRRRIWLILLSVAVAVGAAAYIVYREPSIYQAGAVIRLADSRSAITGGLEGKASTSWNPWSDPVQSQIHVLRSRGVAQEVVNREALGLRIHTRGFPAHLVDSVQIVAEPTSDTLQIHFAENHFLVRGGRTERQAPYGTVTIIDGVRFTVLGPAEKASGLLTIQPPGPAVDELIAGLRAVARKYTDIIDVDYSAQDPYVAQRVVNAVVEVFRQLNAEKAQEQSRRRRIFLEEQLAQTDALLAQAQNALSDFASREQVYNSQERISAEQSGVMALDVRREELAADRRVYQFLLEALTVPSDSARENGLRALVSAPGLASNPVVSQLYGQLVNYETIRDTMTTGSWASARSNPDVQRLDTLVMSTRSKLVSASRSHIAAVDARLEALDELKAKNASALQQLPATQASEARLTQQVDVARKMAEQLRQEYQRARIAEAVEGGTVEIIDFATLPGPTSEGVPLKLTMGLIIGLIFGAGGAFLLERLNTAIRRREDIEATLHVPGLAVIPQIAGNGNGRRRRLGALRLSGLGGLIPSGKANGSSRQHTLVTVSNAQSSEAEAYRTLRTNLIFSQAIQTLRTIVITSPSPQDGKTTTAANLAVAFAHQGIRVLLMDCDLRKSRVHTVFNVTREPGLTQVIVGEREFKQVVRPSVVDGLSYVTAGPAPPNPSELLGGPQMRGIIQEAARAFDVVVMDTPPIHVAADAQILGAISDGVLLVLRAGQTERQSAQEAVSRLGNVGARVVGAVLNDPDHKVPAYGGSYYYYNYYDRVSE